MFKLVIVLFGFDHLLMTSILILPLMETSNKTLQVLAIAIFCLIFPSFQISLRREWSTKGRSQSVLSRSLVRRYLKKDTKKKFSRVRDILQRSLSSWLGGKTVPSSIEPSPGQVLNDTAEVNKRRQKILIFSSYML